MPMIRPANCTDNCSRCYALCVERTAEPHPDAAGDSQPKAGNGEPPDDGVPVVKFPVTNRLRAQIDDCKKQIGKLNTKRDMLLRQIETLEDAVRELEAKGKQ